MDLTQLRYFQATATSKSLSAASRKLGISQPSLTVAIRQLEKHLGTTLFLREHHGVRLTSTGEVLMRHAANVLSLVEHAEQDIRGLESDEAGSFVIGCHESLGSYFLPGFMSSFLKEAPRIELALWNAGGEESFLVLTANRFTPDGETDTTFGVNGRFQLETDAAGFALLPLEWGRTLIGGVHRWAA